MAVSWSAQKRLMFAAAVPFFIWLAWYSFTTTNRPSAPVGYFAIGMAVLVVLFQAHLARYRLTIDADGLIERSLLGEWRLPFSEIRKVEGIAQKREGGGVTRWAASTDEAFHLVIHGVDRRISVHRWMTGVDELLAALRIAGALERDDPSVMPAFRPSPLNAELNRASDLAASVKLIVVIGVASWIGALVLVAKTGLQLSGNLLVDISLVALVPVAVVLVALARRARSG
jgi:hypothetical protein